MIATQMNETLRARRAMPRKPVERPCGNGLRRHPELSALLGVKPSRTVAFVFAVLLTLVLAPAAAQTALDCIRVERDGAKFRNVCSRNVVIAWCVSEPDDGVNVEHPIVCGNSSSYYGWWTTLPANSTTSTFGHLGGLRWAACFRPKRPVATRGGERYVCRARDGASSDSTVPEPAKPTSDPDPDPDPEAERRFAEKLCAYRRRAVERHRRPCAEGEEISCDIVDAARRNLRRYCS